jgi:hypothetical protein
MSSAGAHDRAEAVVRACTLTASRLGSGNVRSLYAGIGLQGLVAFVLFGCSSGPPPSTSAPPANTAPRVNAETGFMYIVAGGSDSVTSVPGSPGSLYRFRFQQTAPSSDRFTFQDRDLSFYFRPTPTVLHFQVENRQDRPVWIDWDKSSWIDNYGASKPLANADTRWDQRLSAPPPTQIPGLQRHSNFVFPLDYLIDPAGSPLQLHRPLFPEDQNAPQFEDRQFGINLSVRIDDRVQPYSFRFKVASVLPR